MKPLKRITQIPIEGGSGAVSTGALRFKNDWPGLFIRGDDAVQLLVRFRMMVELLKDTKDVRIAAGLASLQNLADIIDRDVVVRDITDMTNDET
jgi:hypothetical protein